jgi:hypothetical protein
VIDGADVEDRIPSGTLEAIRTEEMSPEAATIRILRDARNHGQAVQDSLAETPFLLSRSDTRFLGILTDVRFAARGQQIDGSPAVGASNQNQTALATDALAAQLLEILRRLDECSNDHSLMPFIRRGGHGEMIAWLVRLKAQIEGGCIFDEQALLRDLVLQVTQAKHQGLRDMFSGGLGVAMTAVGAAGVANTITQAVQDANNLLNILGVALEAMLAGHGTLKAMGYVEGSFGGPQWPYLYTAGSKANRVRKRQLIDNLSAGR